MVEPALGDEEQQALVAWVRPRPHRGGPPQGRPVPARPLAPYAAPARRGVAAPPATAAAAPQVNTFPDTGVRAERVQDLGEGSVLRPLARDMFELLRSRIGAHAARCPACRRFVDRDTPSCPALAPDSVQTAWARAPLFATLPPAAGSTTRPSWSTRRRRTLPLTTPSRATRPGRAGWRPCCTRCWASLCWARRRRCTSPASCSWTPAPSRSSCTWCTT